MIKNIIFYILLFVQMLFAFEEKDFDYIKKDFYYFPSNQKPQILTENKLEDLYKSYFVIDVVLRNGYWTPSISLPPQVRKGSRFHIRRVSVWNSVVYLDEENKIELDNGSFYIFEFNDKWKLLNIN